MWKSNKLNELKSLYLESLYPIYTSEEALQIINILINKYFGLSRVDQALDPDLKLSESEMLSLHFAVKQLKKNVPLQYITGEAYFLDLKLKVNNNVLIPRPETEELVNLIVEKESGKKLSLIDIGTGSGCIAIALSKKLNDSTVYALDISKEALEVAKFNARTNNVNIQFVEDDVLSSKYTFDSKFDFIVSNPPYVRNIEKQQMKPNVLDNEPHIALFVNDNDPLKYYAAILEFSKLNLKTGGRLYFEINEALGKKLMELVLGYSYAKVKLHKDINNKDRILTAEKNS
ncbi:MAG: peptide chain release factor N(5)-glutamine methyltransferase [Marinilabiliales bacterium]|nr:MAG: peptide chain release factor N(5)-glutamine methyltransferase [Marinilabiliales bacterium]